MLLVLNFEFLTVKILIYKVSILLILDFFLVLLFSLKGIYKFHNVRLDLLNLLE